MPLDAWLRQKVVMLSIWKAAYFLSMREWPWGLGKNSGKCSLTLKFLDKIQLCVIY